MLNLSMAEPDNMLRPRICVYGVGGAGGNAINNMIRSTLEGCDFVAANTDAQALQSSLAARKLQLGVNLSRGLGAGSKPDIGRAAAEEQFSEILALLEGTDMVFVTAGMGGGTGTGAAPVIARAARESGILTVGVVTKPFHFEGAHRMRQAESGIAELQQYVDTLIVIPNQNLFRIANERTTFAEAFRLADEVLHSGVRGITDLMVMPGFMNLDFADVKTVMGEMGKAMMGTGEGEGENRAIRAAESAISNPLLDDISMRGARGVLINITGGLDMTLFEVDQAANRIREEVDPDAQIKVGSTLGDDMDGRIRVSVIATGIDAALAEQQKQRSAAAQSGSASRVPAEPMRRVAQPQIAMPVKQPLAAASAPAAAAHSVNLTTSYFTMPQAVTPQMVAAGNAPSAHAPAATKQQTSEAVQTPQAEEPARVQILETQAPTAATGTSQPQSNYGRSPLQQSSVKPAVSTGNYGGTPLKAQPQRVAEAPVTPAADMRVTQLTTATPPVTPSPQGAQRSQSLFQRITGFGMVRPSREDGDESDEGTLPASAVTTSAQAPRLKVESTDRPALSTEQADLLEIPAFLRRQNNH